MCPFYTHSGTRDLYLCIRALSVYALLWERVIQYWNLLPAYVKESPSVDSLKINLKLYKNRTLALADQYHRVSTGHFWGVSEHVLSRIETPSAVASRPAFCTYLQENSWIARRKGINIHKANGA